MRAGAKAIDHDKCHQENKYHGKKLLAVGFTEIREKHKKSFYLFNCTFKHIIILVYVKMYVNKKK